MHLLCLEVLAFRVLRPYNPNWVSKFDKYSIADQQLDT